MDTERLADRFEEHRPRLRSVAYRMLGSLSEADDAVQEAWLRLERSDADAVENLGAWLTTVLARVCLNMLRARRTRREESLEVHVPDPIISAEAELEPEAEAVLAESVGLAMHVVLDTLSPAERVAFVLHDMFAVPFDEVARIAGRTEAAVRQLASRARRRVQGAPVPDCGLAEQRRVVNAFFAAAREGDLDALIRVLDPDVVIRSDGGPKRPRDTLVLRGAETVASRAVRFRGLSPYVRPVLVNGAAGVVVVPPGRVQSVLAFTVAGGRVVEIESLTDPDRLAKLDLSFLDETG